MINQSENGIINNRQISFVVTSLFIISLYLLVKDVDWKGNWPLHAAMEIVAAMLAFGAGLLALVRFYTRKSNTYLFVGAAFIGTSLLDGFHAIVSSEFFYHLLPSPPENIIPWSWNASRIFLSLAMLASYLAWKIEIRPVNPIIVKQKTVYIIMGVLTFLSFIFFTFIPLPHADFPDLLLNRPQEFIAAVLFFLALIGYYKKGAWKNYSFEYWIVLSLLINFLSQILFMTFSNELYDIKFDIAHLLKKASYLCIHTGLLTSFYFLFRESEKQKIILLAEMKERELAEKNMAKYRGQNQLILNSATEGIIGLDKQGKHIFINPSALQILGYKQDELLGKDNHSLWHRSNGKQVDNSNIECTISELVKNGTRSHINGNDIFFHKDGSPLQVKFSIAPLKQNKSDIGSLIIFQDITKIRRSEEELFKMSHVVEQSPTIIVITDTNGNIEYVNPAFTKTSGYKPEEVIGKNPRILSSKIDRPDYKDLYEKLKQGETWTGEFHNIKKNGEYYWEAANISPFKNEAGKITKYLALKTDITESKKDQENLKQYAMALEKSNKELEDFAYIASHDLQEPLRKVITFGNRLRDKHLEELPEKAKDYVNRMNGASLRMKTLINDLLDYSRITSKAKDFEKIDLNKLLSDVLQNLEITIEKENATIVLEKLARIEADYSQIYRLIQNILINAIKYRNSEIEPIVKIHCKIADRDGKKVKNKVQDLYCHIFVEDNGIGFDEKYLSKIFAPFQRLHGRQEYQGTGMGLAICSKIVTRHNGLISAKSSPGKGSIFMVILPIEQKKKEEIT